MPSPFNPVRRVYVDYSLRGSAQVQWELEPHFFDVAPWSFQVQEAEAPVAGANWAAVGAPVVGTLVTRVPDTAVRLPAGKEATVFYRVLVSTGSGASYTSPVATVLGNLPKPQWWKYQEFVRKETLRLTRLGQGYGAPGLLLKNKRSGQPCTACTDFDTDEQTDSQCPTCFGQRFVGGFYQAQADAYFDTQPSARYTRTDPQRGTVNDPTVTKGRFVGYPLLGTYDVWVNRASDQRYYLHDVTTLYQLRQVPVAVEATLKLIPFDSVIYTFPLT